MLPAKLRMIPKLLATLSPFLCLAAIVWLQSQEFIKFSQQLNTKDYLPIEQEQSKLIDWQVQSTDLSFGNLKANWSYLNFVQYFGDGDGREIIGYSLVPEYFELIEFTNEIDLKEAQIRAWSGVLVHVKDNQRRREILSKINKIQDEIVVLKQEVITNPKL